MNSEYIVRPYHIPNIKITTDSNDVINLIRLQYGKYITDLKSNDYFEITVLIDHADKFIVKYENITICSENPIQEIDNIIFNKTQYESNILALHAAAVRCNGKAYVFVAPTTTGKTTLTSFLSSSGFDYITDDCVLLLMDSLYVHPYAAPIQLRDGGVGVLKSHNMLPSNLVSLNITDNKRYVYTPKNYVTEPLPLGNIYFIKRNETDNKLVNLSIGEAIRELMQSTVTSYTLTSDYIRFLSKLAGKSCKRLIYKDLEYVLKILRQGG